jgi:glycosyltransferase involved in cell wall biosynthesis
MRVANLMFGRELGGIEQAFLDYNDALLMAGHEVLCISHPLARINERISGDLTSRTLSNFGNWDPIAAFKLGRMLKAFKPDATITHGNRALHLTHKKRKYAGVHIGVTHNYNLKAFSKLDAIFATTRDLQRQALEAGANLTQIDRIPNMVRAPEELPEKPEKSKDDPVIIFTLGRMVAKKGFDQLIEAAAKLRVMTRTPFKIIIGGEGPESPKLRSLIKKHKLHDIVTLQGWIDNKADFYHHCDIFCLPSLHEPFGIVLLEAMAHGVPIISYDSEGPRQIFKEYPDSALLAKTGDVGALAERLSRLMHNPAQRGFMAKQAREIVQQEFALPVISQKIDRALRKHCNPS